MKKRNRNSVPSIMQIASAAGVSHQTVSRIIHGKQHLHRPETVKRVLEVVQKLGYRVNAGAQAMRVGRTESIALLHDWEEGRSSLPYQLLKGIEEVLKTRDYLLTLNRYHEQHIDNYNSIPKILRELRTDGILVNFHTNPPPDLYTLLKNYQVPFIWINIKQPEDAVYPADYQAGYQLTRYFLEKGHRSIAYVCRGIESPLRHYSKDDRLAGYRRAMQEAGLPTWELFEITTVQDYLAFYQAHPEITVFICYGREYIPLGYYLQHAGVLVPEQVEFGCFGERLHPYPGISAVAELPFYQVGKRAVELLLEKVEKNLSSIPSHEVPFTILTNKELIY